MQKRGGKKNTSKYKCMPDTGGLAHVDSHEALETNVSRADLWISLDRLFLLTTQFFLTIYLPDISISVSDVFIITDISSGFSPDELERPNYLQFSTQEFSEDILSVSFLII